jgi:penicillin-binding protein 2
VFANGGKLYRPHLVKEILSASDDLIKKIDEPPIRDNFISERNLKIVREGMRETITAGSASSLGDLPVAVAGKTGTAQWSTKENPHAWFTCFAPYDNPQIVLTILIEEGGEGSSAAVPIAKEVLKWYFKDNKNTNN